MSVDLFTSKELQAIYLTLIEHENSELYMWKTDRLRHADETNRGNLAPTWNKWKQDKIYNFLLRCSTANQLAYAWSYNEEPTCTIGFWDRDTTQSTPFELPHLVDRLSSLRYNCISQGGTEHLTKADEERLEYLIRVLQRRVIQLYERRYK